LDGFLALLSLELSNLCIKFVALLNQRLEFSRSHLSSLDKSCSDTTHFAIGATLYIPIDNERTKSIAAVSDKLGLNKKKAHLSMG
jgi:hypothetical protein